ncbi:hypothetical protein [Paenibacillus yonginensis]|uniref:hypothetical protein n=1 Tax=Paenibacillus yonginensis TaxID=1462996 RepID=UPI0014725604|nr:hypothetical protein [Paenibacillus yonginensis]
MKQNRALAMMKKMRESQGVASRVEARRSSEACKEWLSARATAGGIVVEEL